ncbi:glycosyltransferase family 4 protein [Acinetobacter gerneri]|uniref:glycosyltransferase family 4 protein n=1 Tax=Acinetobacter gerneri TaxID=202952 RepID=UPI002935944A|nr:glycosyltransferase family 4 protein [Acinetobacter gerneri]MDV2440807.1 glycosyltransferase family 4 protein [Acinetobacter gerneri]
MKFVLISNNLTSVKNFRTDLLLDIQSKGYEIHILAPDFQNFAIERKYLKDQKFTLHEIPLNRTGTNPLADLKTMLNIFKILKKIKPQAVLAYTIKPNIYGTLAAYMAKVPNRFVLVSGLGFAFQDNTEATKMSIVKKIVNGLYKTALSCSTKVFFQNPDDQALLKDLAILNPRIPSVVVNGSGVNTDHYYVAPLNRNIHNQKIYKISFLMVARLLKDKGVLEYFQAAKLIKQKFPEAEFNLVGWLDENPAAISKQELDEMVLSKTIQYWGKLSDVRPAIEKSNIFVLPSYREGVPRSVLEAMSMGRAVITTNAPGCRETVIDGDNGFLVNVASLEDLVTKMSIFINNPSLVGSMGARSRQIVLDRYDVKKVNKHMIFEMKL